MPTDDTQPRHPGQPHEPRHNGGSDACAEVAAYLDLAAQNDAPYWARRLVLTALRAWHLSSEVTETTQLLVSELVTNAVAAAGQYRDAAYGQYAASAGRISLTLRYAPGRVIAEVLDPDPHPPVLADADLDAESGRGLMLVQALSKEWSFSLQSSGKVVSCVIGT